MLSAARSEHPKATGTRWPRALNCSRGLGASTLASQAHAISAACVSRRGISTSVAPATRTRSPDQSSHGTHGYALTSRLQLASEARGVLRLRLHRRASGAHQVSPASSVVNAHESLHRSIRLSALVKSRRRPISGSTWTTCRSSTGIQYCTFDKGRSHFTHVPVRVPAPCLLHQYQL